MNPPDQLLPLMKLGLFKSVEILSSFAKTPSTRTLITRARALAELQKYNDALAVLDSISASQRTEEEMNELINEQRAEVIRETELRVDTVFVKPDCPPATKVVKGIRSHVTFAIGRTVITDSQEMNVQAIANYLKEHPDSKASVTGYADKGTGTPEINHRLARQRAEAVRDCLVNKYGIQPERLTVSSMEGDEQPFAENDWNRVVIMIAD